MNGVVIKWLCVFTFFTSGSAFGSEKQRIPKFIEKSELLYVVPTGQVERKTINREVFQVNREKLLKKIQREFERLEGGETVNGQMALADGCYYLCFLSSQGDVLGVLFAPTITLPKSGLVKEMRFKGDEEIEIAGPKQEDGKWLHIDGMSKVIEEIAKKETPDTP